MDELTRLYRLLGLSGDTIDKLRARLAAQAEEIAALTAQRDERSGRTHERRS